MAPLSVHNPHHLHQSLQRLKPLLSNRKIRQKFTHKNNNNKPLLTDDGKPSLPQPPNEPSRGPTMSEEELKKTLEGFEVPPPKKSSPQPEEDRGFEISDDEVLGPPPQMEVMKSSPPKWGGGGGGRPFKKPTQPPSSVSTSGTKPRKWGQVSLSHTQASIPPPPVNLERKVDVQKNRQTCHSQCL